MGPELRALVTKPRGMEVLGEGDVRAQGENEICGDRLAFGARLGDGRIAQLRFQASACPACLAIASCAVEVYEGAALPPGPPFEALRQRVQQLGGLATHEGHALKLVESLLGELRDDIESSES